MFHNVLIKLILLKIDPAPAMCNLKITKSTADPLCPNLPLKGGYSVHPVPAPVSHIPLAKASKIAGGSTQNLKLFVRGKLISGHASIIGSIQLPNPPIATGITKKKIIKIA